MSDDTNDENRQRQMDFILNQQAQHDARLGKLEDLVTRLANISLEKFESLEGKVDVLIDAQIRTEKALTSLTDTTNQVLTALAEAQLHSDKRLDALIDVVRDMKESKVKQEPDQKNGSDAE